MKLPNADKAVVEREKITGYLLNSSHRHGAGKARFFAMHSFRAEQWQRLAEALLEHGRTHEVTTVTETKHGTLFVVEGTLNTPDGRRPQVRSIWQVDKGEIAPRLITAYPLEDS
jgi:hypothetical protein